MKFDKLKKAKPQHMEPTASEDKVYFGPSLDDLVDRKICFALIVFCPENEADVEQMHEAVVDTANTHAGFVDYLVSHLAVVCFGLALDSSTESHRPFIASLITQFGGAIKIAYASGIAQIGNLGGATRCSFSFIHPAFPSVLAELSNMRPGEAHEVVFP